MLIGPGRDVSRVKKTSGLLCSTTDIGSSQLKPSVEHWYWLLSSVTCLQLKINASHPNTYPLWICFFKIKFVHLSLFSTHITSLHLIHFPFHSHFPPPLHFAPSVVFSTAFTHFRHSWLWLQPTATTKTYRLSLFPIVLSTKILFVCVLCHQNSRWIVCVSLICSRVSLLVPDRLCLSSMSSIHPIHCPHPHVSSSHFYF